MQVSKTGGQEWKTDNEFNKPKHFDGTDRHREQIRFVKCTGGSPKQETTSDHNRHR